MAGFIEGIAGGVTGILGGIIGGRARRQEQAKANKEYQAQRSAYENFDFQNAYAGMQNPYEDLKVATGAAEMQSQQVQQTAANTLDALRSGGGGFGAAALAQAIQGQASQSQQSIMANIQQQEASNQMAAAQGQANINQMAAQGAMAVQDMEFGRQETMLGMSQARKASADQARRDATASMLSGIGSLGASAASFGLAGGFGADGAKDALNSLMG
jgi:hypothetical protein